MIKGRNFCLRKMIHILLNFHHAAHRGEGKNSKRTVRNNLISPNGFGREESND